MDNTDAWSLLQSNMVVVFSFIALRPHRHCTNWAPALLQKLSCAFRSAADGEKVTLQQERTCTQKTEKETDYSLPCKCFYLINYRAVQ